MKAEHIAIAAVGTTLVVGAAVVLGRKKRRNGDKANAILLLPDGTSTKPGRKPADLQPGAQYSYTYKTMRIVITRMLQPDAEGNAYSWAVLWKNGSPAQLGTAVSFVIAKSQAEASFEGGS